MHKKTRKNKLRHAMIYAFLTIPHFATRKKDI
jgi:hypothetical protein